MGFLQKTSEDLVSTLRSQVTNLDSKKSPPKKPGLRVLHIYKDMAKIAFDFSLI